MPKDNTFWVHNCPSGTVSKVDLVPEVQELFESCSSDSVEFPSPILRNLLGKAFERHSDQHRVRSTAVAD